MISNRFGALADASSGRNALRAKTNRKFKPAGPADGWAAAALSSATHDANKNAQLRTAAAGEGCDYLATVPGDRVEHVQRPSVILARVAEVFNDKGRPQRMIQQIQLIDMSAAGNRCATVQQWCRQRSARSRGTGWLDSGHCDASSAT